MSRARLGFGVLRGGAAALSLSVSLGGCGYQAAGSASSESLCVRAAQTQIPDLRAVAAALDGARQVLAEHGALRSGEELPCLTIELLRVDETAQGLQAASPVQARGTEIAVVARGWLDAPNAAPARDSGDVRRSSSNAAVQDSIASGAAYDALIDAAAERAGRSIAQRVLGYAAAADDP